MSEVAKYRKLPVEIEAMQWDASELAASNIIDWILDSEGGSSARFHGGVDVPEPSIAIDTLEGTMRAVPGDYIIRGVQGEFYPCKPEIFEATYEPAPSSPGEAS